MLIPTEVGIALLIFGNKEQRVGSILAQSQKLETSKLRRSGVALRQLAEVEQPEHSGVAQR